MALTRQQINELRAKTAAGPFIYLVEFYNSAGNVIERLTNHFKTLVFEGETFKEFPFLVKVPSFSGDLTASIQMTFMNYPTPEVANIKSIVDQTRRAVFQFINVNMPDSKFFPKATFFFSKGDSYQISVDSIEMSLSKKIINDSKFPFRRFNSVDHPTLYQDRSGFSVITPR